MDTDRPMPSISHQGDISGVDFSALVTLSNDAILLMNLDGSVRFVSPAAERLFGWSWTKLADNLTDLVYIGTPNSDAELLHDILCGTANPDAPLPHADLQLRTAFGPHAWAEVTVHLLQDSDGKPESYAVFIRSIAKQKELENQLEAATQTDPVTGLFNRRAFEEGLRREWAVALREKTHTSLIKISIDKFDALTNHYGPSGAEDCLVKVATTLKETARRPADIAARTSNSEFSLLLPRTHEIGAETISAYLHVAIKDLAIPNPDNTLGDGIVTASVGAACSVAESTGASESSEFLLAAAENCVFRARQEGGDRVKTVMNYLGR
ncbi:sensor domain-containing diguanylate cyclase [Roseibium denhamense]|uniref:sensor domain-containing diguanylate cyclase n=1 Tax=Roseibium denhamense TaxID=76305 RepID=UPI001AD8D3EA|nr:diguanylate cyclase [Roseibium denhamense]